MRRLKTINLTAAVEEYLRYMVANGRRPRTVQNTGYVLTGFAKAVGDKPTRKLGPADLTRARGSWGSTVLTDGNTASTINFKRTLIGTFLRWCEMQDYVQSCDRVMSGMQAMVVEQRERLYLSADACQQFLDSIEHPRDRALCAVAMFSGLRASDIVTLRVGDVDLAAGVINAKIQKTGVKDDALPIMEELAEEMRTWLRWYGKHVGRPLDPSWHLVPAKSRPDMRKVRQGSRGANWAPLKPTQQMAKASQKMSALLRAAGYDATGEGMHTLRRSVARLLFDDLCDKGEVSRDQALMIVKETLHHRSATMTESYIGRSYGRELRNVRLHGRWLFGPQKGQENVIPLRREMSE